MTRSLPQLALVVSLFCSVAISHAAVHRLPTRREVIDLSGSQVGVEAASDPTVLIYSGLKRNNRQEDAGWALRATKPDGNCAASFDDKPRHGHKGAHPSKGYGHPSSNHRGHRHGRPNASSDNASSSMTRTRSQTSTAPSSSPTPSSDGNVTDEKDSIGASVSASASVSVGINVPLTTSSMSAPLDTQLPVPVKGSPVSTNLPNPSPAPPSESVATTAPTSPAPSKPSVCPSGYAAVTQGEAMQANDGDLIDLKGLKLGLDILNFGREGDKGAQQTEPSLAVKNCQSATCCFKPVPIPDVSNNGSNGGNDSDSSDSSNNSNGSSTGHGRCPPGYSSASQGQAMDMTDNDLIDLQDTTITLNVLHLGSEGQPTTSSSGHLGQKCTALDCCYKPSSGVNDKADQSNDDDLIDGKDIGIHLCLLSGTC